MIKPELKIGRVGSLAMVVVLMSGLVASCGDSGGNKDAASDAKADATDAARDTGTPTDVRDGATTDVVVDGTVAETGTDVPVTPDGAGTDLAPTDGSAVDVPAVDLAPTDVAVGDTATPDVATPDASVDTIATTVTVGGTIAGLTGTGLVLRDNGGDNLTVPAAATTFTFATRVAAGAAYAVTVFTQPGAPTQTCTVANGTGTAGTANVTNVAITCVVQSFTVGGTVSGLVGTGLILRDTTTGNATTNLPITANGAFTFPSLPSGNTYAVTVFAQPGTPTQICTVANGMGTVGAANVTNVAVTCASQAFTVGGTVAGLTGTGLVLQNNAMPTTNLPVSANGAFTFSAPVASGAAYAVTVATQPTGQTCTVGAGGGTIGSAAVTNVAVTCAATTYSIGGTVSGLTSTGVTLQNNGGSTFTVSANGGFVFPTQVVGGSTYAVTVSGQPAGQVCTVTGGGNGTGGGTIAAAAVTNLVVTCTSTFTLGGTVSGLTGAGLVLRNTTATVNTDLPVAAGATTFTFGTRFPTGAMYAVSVLTQPAGQICSVATGTGTFASANIANVAVTCTSTFTLGGTVSGLTGAGLVLRNTTAAVNTDLPVPAASTTFTFGTRFPTGAMYAVTVLTQPAGQACSVATGTGTFASANIANVAVTCVAATFTVGGPITGLTTGGLVLQNNAGSNLTVASGAITFQFTGIGATATYAVTILTQPATQSCRIVSGGTGTVASANVNNVNITCTNDACGSADEGAPITVACAAGQVITSIRAAFYGTPTGGCGGYAADPACNAPDALAGVMGRCLPDMMTCMFSVGNDLVAADPCAGPTKSLVIQASCQ